MTTLPAPSGVFTLVTHGNPGSCPVCSAMSLRLWHYRADDAPAGSSRVVACETCAGSLGGRRPTRLARPERTGRTKPPKEG